MRFHHTKTKGDLGVFRAQLDLAEKGYGVFLPLTEHEAFDLVAYKNGLFQRVQVKYRSADDGKLFVRFSSSWADRHGVHIQKMDKAEVDVVCIYCPDTQLCYYFDPLLFRKSVTLRVTPARNSQTKGVLPAENYRNMPPARIAV